MEDLKTLIKKFLLSLKYAVMHLSIGSLKDSELDAVGASMKSCVEAMGISGGGQKVYKIEVELVDGHFIWKNTEEIDKLLDYGIYNAQTSISLYDEGKLVKMIFTGKLIITDTVIPSEESSLKTVLEQNFLVMSKDNDVELFAMRVYVDGQWIIP